MSRDVRGKIAAGETLDADDIRYALDRGIPLPAGTNIPEELGVADGEIDLDSLTKAELVALAEERQIENVNMSQTKPEMISAIMEAESESPDDGS